MRFNWNWLNKNKRVFYYFSFTSHFTVWLWSNLPDSSSSPFFLLCLLVASVQFILLVNFFTKNALFVSHTHTHQSINQKCRDQRTIRSPSSPRSRSKRDLKFPRTSPSAFYFTSSQSSSISLLSKKNARDRASRNCRLSFSPSRFKCFPALIARNRLERNSYETYWPILSLLLRPNSMSQTVKTAISGTHFIRFFRLLFLLLLFSFRFFWKSHVKLAGEFSTCLLYTSPSPRD